MARKRSARARSVTTKLTTPALAVARAVNSTASRGGGRAEHALTQKTAPTPRRARNENISRSLARQRLRFNRAGLLDQGRRAVRVERERSRAGSVQSQG